jgi:hypothetical protein
LGDDIVLFDKDVATSYLDIMSKLGVEINLSKSVISDRSAFEFAKVTGLSGKDVSALPWKAFISQNSMMGRVNILFALLQRNICSKSWVNWFTKVSKHKKSSPGDVNFSLLAL